MPSWSDGVPFAVDAEGRFRDVDEVPRGLACGCVCADCGTRVVAKKGEINAHHFAHYDRSECRNALEASLYGMVMTLIKDPSLILLLPPAGDRRELVPHPEQIFSDSQSEAFFKTAWVIPPRQVSAQGATIASETLAGSSLERPDILLPDVSIHIASHLKQLSELARLRISTGPSVLALNLQSYVKIWWQICDAHKEERLKHAATATDAMRRWLETEAAGRHWLFHCELEQKKSDLRVWIRDKSTVAAAWRRQQETLRIPVLPSVEPRAYDDPVGCVRLLQEVPWLTFNLAEDLGLLWDPRRKRYVAYGKSGTSVSPTVGKLLDPSDDWRSLSASDRAALQRPRAVRNAY